MLYVTDVCNIFIFISQGRTTVVMTLQFTLVQYQNLDINKDFFTWNGGIVGANLHLKIVSNASTLIYFPLQMLLNISSIIHTKNKDMTQILYSHAPKMFKAALFDFILLLIVSHRLLTCGSNEGMFQHRCEFYHTLVTSL